MLKSKTHFEQIPLQKVKEAIVASAGVQENGSGTLSGPGPILRCRICRKPVPVETAKTDGEGQAIHEEAGSRLPAAARKTLAALPFGFASVTALRRRFSPALPCRAAPHLAR